MPGPTPRDLIYAAWVRARPDGFRPMAPTLPALPYAGERAPGVPRLVDVYLPGGDARHPSVIIVHGGGFILGSRRMKPVRFLATRLCEAGVAVCAVDHRLLFRGGGLEAQLADVDAAAAFWRERAEELGCDPQRISMLGLSAGAGLMLISAARASAPYHRLVSVYGVLDFDVVRGGAGEMLLGRLLGTSDRSAWAARSPVEHASHDPPLLLIHGTEDRLVPAEHSLRVHQRRAALGLPTRLELFDGMRHGWLNDASLPQSERAISLVLEFLR